MKRILRSILNFLERKFPDKVVVTAERYTSIADTVAMNATHIIKHEERLKDLETRMSNIDIALGFKMPKVGILER